MQLLGERLRMLREGLNMTQYQVGEILGIPQTSIHRYEIGAYTLTVCARARATEAQSIPTLGTRTGS